jgi:tRNA(Ile)-lysidine synthase
LLAPLRGKRLAVALSGGVDSVVLLHLLRSLRPQFGYRLSAVHVNHGISPNADGWEEFCVALCRDLEVPLTVKKVKVNKAKHGLEAAAREARRAALARLRVDAIALAHHLDDQAETVLLNLLRGAGIEGASGMAARSRLGSKILVRPLLQVSRREIAAYAAEHRLGWIEDESNADVALTRNFLRHRVGPLLESRFPRWREALARAARHFSKKNVESTRLLRAFLSSKGLKAPSEAKLAELLKQLEAGRGAIEHEGMTLRFYRGKVFPLSEKANPPPFKPKTWNGEPRLALPALGGELRFKRARGRGIDRSHLETGKFQVRLRSGGERLQLDAKRPRRTLKNLFQEAGVPPWERERLPLLYRGADLVWAPGLGVDVKFLAPSRAEGLLPEWTARAK